MLVPREGMIAAYGDAEPVVRVSQRTSGQTVRYGFGMVNDWRAVDVRLNSMGGSDFTVWHGAERVREFSLRIPGRHNVLNALAVLIVADRLGIDLVRAWETLSQFRGVARRFEVKGDFGGVTIIDDYAHHPSEIRATLEAARGRYPNRDIWAVFQPHTYSRTLALLERFADAFSDADHVVVTEIFAAREHDAHGLSGKRIVEHMKHRDARFAAELDESVAFLAQHLRKGDVLITLGAGDVYRVAEAIAQQRQGA
jgi:UDP-N-acetylmuramate--alanine ligase